MLRLHRSRRSESLDYKAAVAVGVVLGVDGVVVPFFTGKTLHELAGFNAPYLYSEACSGIDKICHGYSANEGMLFAMMTFYAHIRKRRS
jgi:hypothetical protein